MNLLSIYEKPNNASILFPRFYVEGMLVGASACPEIPLPDKWLPWAIEHHGKMNNEIQADQITDALFEYFKWCLAAMRDETISPPDYANYDLHNQEALSLWLKGLLSAHTNLQDIWQMAWSRMQEKDVNEAPKLAKNLKHCLSVFSTFADADLAITQAKERGELELEKHLPVIAKSLPNALTTYVTISGTLASYLPNQFETFES